MLVRRVVVIVLVLVLVLGVVRGGRRPVRQAGGVTRPSHSAAEIRICNTQQPLPTSHPFSIFINLTVRSCARCLFVLLSLFFLHYFIILQHNCDKTTNAITHRNNNNNNKNKRNSRNAWNTVLLKKNLFRYPLCIAKIHFMLLSFFFFCLFRFNTTKTRQIAFYERHVIRSNSKENNNGNVKVVYYISLEFQCCEFL